MFLNKRIYLLCNWIITTFLFTTANGFSQFSHFQNFSVKDGLPSSEVYEMIQDSKGYLWFPTDMGVSRFNGYEFKNFNTENGLPDNTIYGVYEDRKNNIWFRSQSGALSYFKNDSIYELPCNNKLKEVLKSVIVLSMCVDSKDTIWLGVTDGFVLKIAPGRKPGDVSKVEVEKTGAYIFEVGDHFVFGGKWLIPARSKKSMIRVYTPGKMFQYESTMFPPNIIPRYTVTKEKKGEYFVTIDGIIVHLNREKILSENKISGRILSKYKDKDVFWLGTNSGVKTNMDTAMNNSSVFKQFDNKVITAIHIDNEKGLWICTKGQGVYYAPYRNFKYYTTLNGFPESSICCMGSLNDKVITGHLNGEITSLQGEYIKTRSLPMNRLGEASNEINSFFDLDAGHLLISSNLCVYTLDKKSEKISVFSDNGRKKIIKSRTSNELWTLGFRRLLKTSGLPGLKILNSVSFPSYTDNLYQDKTNKIWICSSEGLFSIDTLMHLSFEGNRFPLLASRVVDIAEDSAGFMWMATRGKGVFVKNGDNFVTIDKTNGLTSNMCKTIFIENVHTIWVGTNKGLNRISVISYRPFRYTIKNYTSDNGLLTSEVNYIVKSGNKLWFAHNNGISVVDPDHILDNTIPPPVYITEVLVNEKNIEYNRSTELQFNENRITIHYNGLSFKNAGHVQYKYRVTGLDTSWIYTNNTSVNLQALNPGNYKFIIYAKNTDGYWSTTPAVFRFIIHPAWWQTWWFRILTAILIITCIALFFRYRLRVIRKREYLKTMQQTRLAEAELKALRAQMNPHFVFNAINSVQYFITNNDPVSSQKYLSKFARLIRYVVDNSKPSTIPLAKELEALRLYLDLESLRFHERFEFTIDIGKGIDPDSMHVPSMLIQPYVENAIWHGLMHKNSKGRISISLTLKDRTLICKIEDNGIGRKKSQEIREAKGNEFHKSVGMSVTQERLDIINQQYNSRVTVKIKDLEDNLGNNMGTSVELILPFY